MMLYLSGGLPASRQYGIWMTDHAGQKLPSVVRPVTVRTGFRFGGGSIDGARQEERGSQRVYHTDDTAEHQG